LHKAGRHAEAWQQAVPANRRLFPTLREDLDQRLDRQRTSLVSLQNDAAKARGNGITDTGNPISLFILAPSRSGKTSMEMLVSTLEGVKRGYENPSVDIAVARTFQTSGLLTSRRFEHVPAQLYSLCRDIYLEELARRAGSASVFTNTHPGRIHDVPRLVSAFPNVRFIFVKRNLEDTLLRMFLRQYSSGNAYAYDLKAGREHILWYHEMMDRLADKFPDIARVIQYEDMVADPSAALRIAAELCGLPMPNVPAPPIGDDRGCAAPYRELMAAELKS